MPRMMPMLKFGIFLFDEPGVPRRTITNSRGLHACWNLNCSMMSFSSSTEEASQKASASTSSQTQPFAKASTRHGRCASLGRQTQSKSQPRRETPCTSSPILATRLDFLREEIRLSSSTGDGTVIYTNFQNGKEYHMQ